jgi:hypothetical protein
MTDKELFSNMPATFVNLNGILKRIEKGSETMKFLYDVLMFNLGSLIGCIILYLFKLDMLIILLSFIISNIFNLYLQLLKLTKVDN